MQLRPSSRPRSGIALIIVMVSIFALAMLAAAFAMMMKEETKLARNSQFDDELFWLGRSGVEAARLVLTSSSDPYDSLVHLWAGGLGSPSESNSVVRYLPLDNWQIGGGTISFTLDGNPVVLRITDEERKANINTAGREVLQQAMLLTGCDAAESSVVIDSIIDWIDPDNFKNVNGWESRDYEALTPAYFAKDGPLDDISELQFINGVSSELYWGPRIAEHPEAQVMRARFQRQRGFLRQENAPPYQAGLVDLFCCISGGQININTADLNVLQLVPGIDAITAANIVQMRAGEDGQDGTEDDVPFHNVGELVNVPGISPVVLGQFQNQFTVRSTTFTVHVEARIGDVTRKYRALVRRINQRDVPLYFMEAE